MIRVNDILTEVKKHNASADLGLIKKAYVFSAAAHDGQKRRSGDPYLNHPLAVAYILALMRMDAPSVVTGLLHDTVEDNPKITLKDIDKSFGTEVRQLVDGVTKIDKISFTSLEHQQAENFKKLLLATNKDVRVILVKLADRVHNMRTLEHMKREKRWRISKETQDIYAPLANRFGIQWVKNELEDLSFRFMDPKSYYDIIYRLSQGRKERDIFIKEVVDILKELMAAHGIECTVKGREKNAYSIFRKMKAQGLEFDQVHDLIAFRIILGSIGECYEAMGYIHSKWTPVPGRIKDYIAIPKTNGYQSLHTTVIGPMGQRMEVQMRTLEMNSIAEEGVAAHWVYKEEADGKINESERFRWLGKLLEFDQETNPREYLDMVKTDLFPDEVYVLTPNGDVMSFPKDSTPIDFAYRIHTEVGNQCVGAKVNGKMVPLTYKLSSGERVEIMTRKGHTPSHDWLKIVKTNSARSKIREFLRKEEMTHSLATGRSLVEKEMRKFKLSLGKAEKTGRLHAAAEAMGCTSVDKMLSDIGIGKITLSQFMSQIIPPEDGAGALKEAPLERVLRPFKKDRGGIKIQGINDMVFSLAKCCNPLPGEEVKGFISLGQGIKIHAADCVELEGKDPARIVDVDWDLSKDLEAIAARLDVYANDEPLMLSNTSKVIGSYGVNIHEIRTDQSDDGTGVMHYEVLVKSIEQLNALIADLGKVRGVLKVVRIRS